MTVDRPLKIVHVSTQRAWHGGEEQARLLALGLRQRGHQCLILARQGGQFARRLSQLDFHGCTFPGRGRNPRAMWIMRRVIAKWRPDVVHFHDAHGLTGAGLAMTGLGVPARIAARRVDFPIRSAWIYKRFCDRVIAVSEAVANVCVRGGIPNSMLRIVHDGVDPARAESGDRARGRQSLGLHDDDLLMLSVATLTDHKGHTFLLQALPKVLARVPRAVIALAGDGDLRPQLEAQSKSLGVSRHVRFLGYRHDVPDLLRAADLFVMPSHLEGLGSSLIDVMFARLAIVTTTAGGIPELVGRSSADGVDDEPVALMVPPRDPPALAAAIIEALQDPALRAELIDRAERRARRSFTADCMVERTLAVYREVLESRF